MCRLHELDVNSNVSQVSKSKTKLHATTSVNSAKNNMLGVI